MSQRRFTRLTNDFSRKLDNHVAPVALHIAQLVEAAPALTREARATCPP
jgi:hypothetical protein